MTPAVALAARLQFLNRVAARECRHLQTTDRRLFTERFTERRAAGLEEDPDQAERVRFIASSETWLAMRQLRNQMVHEYIEDPAILASALQAGHDFVPQLIGAAEVMTGEIFKRGWGG